MLAVSPFHPVATPHPLVGPRRGTDGPRGYDAPPTDAVIAAELTQALGYYDDVPESLRNDLIEEAKTLPGVEQINMRMLAAADVLTMRAARGGGARGVPSPAAFRALAPDALAPLADLRLAPPERAEAASRQTADLLRVVRWLVAARSA
jgi:hypothetical protein